MTEDRYATVICNACAQNVGVSTPTGHLATYYEDVCEGCGCWSIVTSSRDYRFPKIKKKKHTVESRHRLLEELKHVKMKYQCQGNSGASDEIDRKIAEILEETFNKSPQVSHKIHH